MSHRAGQQTASAVGVGTTNRNAEARVARLALVARLDEPAPAELRWHVDRGLCWWCQDNRTFKALGGHLARAHGIDLAELRDVLFVPKRFAFISPETHELLSQRSQRNYDPAVLTRIGKPKVQRVLNKYGRASNRAKWAAVPYEQKRESWRLASARSAELRRERATIEYTCRICGQGFSGLKGSPRVLCSKSCKAALLRKLSKSPAFQTHYQKRRQYLPCTVCGTAIRSKRRTCGPDCEKVSRSNSARGRLDHLDRIRALRRFPERGCSFDGCTTIHLTHGLCSKHWQRLIARCGHNRQAALNALSHGDVSILFESAVRIKDEG